MKARKLVTLLMIASLFYWVPTIIPARALVPCGSVASWMTDTAYAAAVTPCPSHAKPWSPFAIIAGAASVILNAVYISKTQCRELTQQEAMASGFLPFVGYLWNKQQSKCRR
jgi:hypothetical protein